MEMMSFKDDDETDWLDLPIDLLFRISDKVISFSLADYVRFGSICFQWRSFFIENHEQIKLSSKLPVLLIPSFNFHHHSNYQKHKPKHEEDMIKSYNYYNPKKIWLGLDHEQRHNNTRSFYSLFERKVYDFQLPVPSYMSCRGSSHGWLVLVEESLDGTYPIRLFNPFKPDDKNNKIHLPPLSTLHSINPNSNTLNSSFFMKKVIFSRSPSSMSSSPNKSNPTTSSTTDDDDVDQELIVLGLCYCGRAEFWRPGDGAWTVLPTPDYSPVDDVIYYRGRFWGILQTGSVVVFDLAPEPKFTIVVHHPYPSYPINRYLVESAGDLFQAERDVDISSMDCYSTVGFQVFKLDPATMQWVKTNTLDGSMFFLGDNTSMSLTITDYYPEWCKPNSIYFTDDYSEGFCTQPWTGPHDIGVFNLEDGSFEPHYKMEYKPIVPAPIWIQPML